MKVIIGTDPYGRKYILGVCDSYEDAARWKKEIKKAGQYSRIQYKDQQKLRFLIPLELVND